MTDTSTLLAEFFKTIAEMQNTVQDEITKIFEGLIDEAENMYNNYQNESVGTKKRKIEIPATQAIQLNSTNNLGTKHKIEIPIPQAIQPIPISNFGAKPKIETQAPQGIQPNHINNLGAKHKIEIPTSQAIQPTPTSNLVAKHKIEIPQAIQLNPIKKVGFKETPKVKVPSQNGNKNNFETSNPIMQTPPSNNIPDSEEKKEAKIINGQLVFVKTSSNIEAPKVKPFEFIKPLHAHVPISEPLPEIKPEIKLKLPNVPKSDYKIINCSSMINKSREIPTKRPKKEKPIDIRAELKRKYTPLLENIKEEIKKLYSKGIDPTIISKLFQISSHLVHSIGNWGQLTSNEIRGKIDLKAQVFSLLAAGASPQNICIKLNLSRGEFVNLTEEIPIYSIIKSPKAKIEFYELIKDSDLPKQTLSELTGIPQPKLWKWKEKVEANIPLSDEDSVNSDGEFSRETIKKALACLYATQSIEQAAKAAEVQNKDKILEWKRKFKEKR
ncbi:unnamed protein product [Blepharisma stoltei]|uniref:ELK domain-containing protein n=1 Tax=Blepharisma stoltei TaxID=1481888 RepID=A0AAU9K0M5_9CILI|nr:unnamed protein product [Blepharisma stoltei]